MSFAINVGKQLYGNGWDFENVDWGSAISDGIVAAAFLGNIVISFWAEALDYTIEERMNNINSDFSKSMINGALVSFEGV